MPLIRPNFSDPSITLATVNPSVLLIVLLSLVGLALALIVVVTIRRRSISKLSGAFDCSINVGEESSSRPRWRLGVAVFSVASLDWYPVFALTRRAAVRLPRADLDILVRRKPTSGEQYSVLPDAVVVDCSYGKADGRPRSVSLAMDTESLSTMASWLESSPPGFNPTMGRFT
ncbi:DUF2550 domain-containing protein [Brevibacterium marinum]|uniref:DUF2550 domain-containing protein n=1 Tax=Brevibacterium marinum TaxID=418643 RepID=UPI001FD82017|nr:DUF2550 domain-containing protein [Brevibacterium marinum]